MLFKALDVVMKALASVAFASQEVPRSAWLSISSLEVITKFPLKVSPSFEHALMKVVYPVPGSVNDEDWKILNHEKRVRYGHQVHGEVIVC